MNHLLKVFTFLSISALVGCNLISKYVGSDKTPDSNPGGGNGTEATSIDIDTLKKGVVNIRCNNKNDAEENGTGFIISSLDDWLIVVSAYHVIGSCGSEIKIKFYERRTLPMEIGTVAHSDPDSDVTLLRVKRGNLREEDFHIFHLSSSLPKETDHVRIIGFPANSEWYHSSVEVISSSNRKIQTSRISVSGSSKGLSGGPVIKDRKVVGMIKTDSQNIMEVVPASILIDFAKEFRVRLPETPTMPTVVTTPGTPTVVPPTMSTSTVKPPATVTVAPPPIMTITGPKTPTITGPKTPTITGPRTLPVKCNCGVIKSKLEMSFQLSIEERHCITTKCPHLQR